MSIICPIHVLYMSKICPCPLYDLYLSPKSNLCPHQISFLSSPSHFCPLFVIYVWQNSLKNWWTKTSQNLDFIFFTFTIWSHCRWTNNGQSLDSRKSNFCPLIVQVTKLFPKICISQYLWLRHILDKYWNTNPKYVQYMTKLCLDIVQPKNGPLTHSP